MIRIIINFKPSVMRKVIFQIIFLTAICPLISGQGIGGSAHDFSGDGWSGGQICIVCHTPHNADATVAESPLWNHEVTDESFTVYTSATLDATDVGQPSASSKLCLSCHDGTIALDSYGGMTGSSFISGSANLGNDISNDHPISFAYNTALSTEDGGLHDPSTANSGLGGTIDDDLLYAEKMECASCHDVHNSSNLSKRLIKSNAASALCLTCHNK